MLQETFTCVDCHKILPVNKEGGTGYAHRIKTNEHGPAGKVCYDCCGKCDKHDLEIKNRAILYLVKRNKWVVTNWPGTLEFEVHSIRKGSHNIARTRTDVWFRDHTGCKWWGVQYGNYTQIVHCRKLKGA